MASRLPSFSRLLSFLALALVLAPLPAGAADHPVGGDKLMLKDPSDPNRRLVRFRATRDTAIDPSAAADPRTTGATLEITGNGAGDGATGPIPLDQSLWTGLGRPAGSKGYKYLDPNAANGVKKVYFKSGNMGGSLLVSGGGGAWPYQVTQAQSGVGLRFGLGTDLYCAEFTSFSQNQAGKVNAKNAPAPNTCATPTPPVCGDGVAQAPEQCDDNNTDNGDGCSATCQLENASALCAGIAPVSGTALNSVLVASGLSSPVHVTAPPLDPNRVFVVEQTGRVRLIKNGSLMGTPFLDIHTRVQAGGEQGLLSMAFHPDYKNNGRFFVSYTESGGARNIVAEYHVSGNLDVASNTEDAQLLKVDQPFSNHNGGQIAFGPDGFLYVSRGDGGGGGDPLESGQDDASALGKLLRIDVDAPTADPVDAIWAKGLRNPWRFSFDRGTGDLYVADVGQNQWEEVDVQAGPVPAGVNYGWDVFEGRHCYEPDPLFPAGDCSDVPANYSVEPVLEYDHGEGCSITGGFVYRGCRMPDVRGTYFYSDYCTAFIRTFKGVSGGDAQNLDDVTGEVAPGGGLSIDNVSSFGEDARGELYICDIADGEVYKIVPGP